MLTVAKRTGRICEPKRNALDPVRVSKWILISETVLQFGGIRYDNKPPVDNIFLNIYLAKKPGDDQTVYENSQHKVIVTSDCSSENEPLDGQDNVQTQPQGHDAHFPQDRSDSEEESEDLLAGRHK